jgi:hypothetical protein
MSNENDSTDELDFIRCDICSSVHVIQWKRHPGFADYITLRCKVCRQPFLERRCDDMVSFALTKGYHTYGNARPNVRSRAHLSGIPKRAGL